MPQIHFNGKTYNDLAEMPATEREKYDQLMSVMQDADGNGVPDVFEGDVVNNIIKMIKTSDYDNDEGVSALEQMPPEVRARISKVVAKMVELGLVSGVKEFSLSSQPSAWEDAEIHPSRPIISQRPAIQDDTSPRWMLLLVVLIGILLLGAGVAAFLLMAG